MNPNQKINYDRVMQKMVQVWGKEWGTPNILMHVAIAPCSTYTLEYPNKVCRCDHLFCQFNIHPKAEYHKRAYVTKICQWFQWEDRKYGPVFRAYEPNEYRKLVRGLEEEPEGGDRCKVCFDCVWIKQHR